MGAIGKIKSISLLSNSKEAELLKTHQNRSLVQKIAFRTFTQQHPSGNSEIKQQSLMVNQGVMRKTDSILQDKYSTFAVRKSPKKP